MSDPVLGAQNPKTKSRMSGGKAEQRGDSRSDPEERGARQSVASERGRR